VKNPTRLVRALARAKSDLHLLVLGEGELRDDLTRTACELGVPERVHLVGFQDDTARWYSAMDVFALSSDSEQMPVALLEAMASGLPVVSTDVGDVRLMLADEQHPYVVALDAADVERELARALDGLAGDEALAARLGQANRARARERYAFETMLSCYHDLYESALRR